MEGNGDELAQRLAAALACAIGRDRRIYPGLVGAGLSSCLPKVMHELTRLSPRARGPFEIRPGVLAVRSPRQGAGTFRNPPRRASGPLAPSGLPHTFRVFTAVTRLLRLPPDGAGAGAAHTRARSVAHAATSSDCRSCRRSCARSARRLRCQQGRSRTRARSTRATVRHATAQVAQADTVT